MALKDKLQNGGQSSTKQQAAPLPPPKEASREELLLYSVHLLEAALKESSEEIQGQTTSLMQSVKQYIQEHRQDEQKCCHRG